MRKTIKSSILGRGRSSRPPSKVHIFVSLIQILVFVLLCCLIAFVTYRTFLMNSTNMTKNDNNKSSNDLQNNNSKRISRASQVPDPFLLDDSGIDLTTVQAVRNEFYRRYGGKVAAESLLARGVKSYGSIKATAERMLRSVATHEPFAMAFAGYSVTVGRGNHLSQSFPFVLGRILKPLLEHSLSISIKVRNAAIGGIPSFPYAFCFEHFLGIDPQVISWDYSMNEGNGASIMESYLRHSQHQLTSRPMMIALDTNKQRCKMLQQYTEQGLLQDAICVGKADDAIEDRNLLNLPDSAKPPGFQHWEEFGAPLSCPGRGSWHPRKMEHELIGWMITMYFVDAVEEAQKMMMDKDWQTKLSSKSKKVSAYPIFPPPLVPPPANDQRVTDLLFGHATASQPNDFILKQISCRTNFLPASDQEKVLPSIVVSGLAHGISSENIIKERSDDAYRSGWVLDVSSVERKTKIQVEQCGGLGYIDLKTALYGIPESGILRLWLPHEGGDHEGHDHTDDDEAASHWYDELIICEANEKRDKDACHLDSDLHCKVGGVEVASTAMISGAAEYLKRKTCAHVGIPHDAKITRLRDVKKPDGSKLTSDEHRRLSLGGLYRDDHIGLIVDLSARASVNRKAGACCLSHIVWEQH